jgi:hypothetical protein
MTPVKPPEIHCILTLRPPYQLELWAAVVRRPLLVPLHIYTFSEPEKYAEERGIDINHVYVKRELLQAIMCFFSWRE